MKQHLERESCVLNVYQFHHRHTNGKLTTYTDHRIHWPLQNCGHCKKLVCFQIHFYVAFGADAGWESLVVGETFQGIHCSRALHTVHKTILPGHRTFPHIIHTVHPFPQQKQECQSHFDSKRIAHLKKGQEILFWSKCCSGFPESE